MSKRKLSKKEVAISIAAAALAIATVGGAVAIHKDSSNSNTGHSITVEQSDYSKKKEEAIQQIQDAVKDLSDDQQSEIDSYIKQNIENIQKAESERTIESTLQETLDYIDQRSLSEKEEQRKETQTTEHLLPVKGRLLLPLYQKKINTISLGKIIFMKITTIFQLSIKVTGSICLMKRKTIG